MIKLSCNYNFCQLELFQEYLKLRPKFELVQLAKKDFQMSSMKCPISTKSQNCRLVSFKCSKCRTESAAHFQINLMEECHLISFIVNNKIPICVYFFVAHFTQTPRIGSSVLEAIRTKCHYRIVS